MLHLRAKLYATIRAFFARRAVLEVETPLLSQGGTTDANIESFLTHFNGQRSAGESKRYLRTSSEFAQKRLLCAGLGDCYELGRVFRNGEAGRRHNPEFTMLEWYRVGWDHMRLIEEVVALIRAALAIVDKKPPVEKYTYRELFMRHLRIDPHRATVAELQSALGVVQINPEGLLRDDWLDLLITHRIVPSFLNCITIIVDYPDSQCALAKIRIDAPDAGNSAKDAPVDTVIACAERFEIYVGTQEIANGYHELTDANELRARFERDNLRRIERMLAPVTIDQHLIDAMQTGMPDCAGVALGIERLLMTMTDSADIQAVLAFAFANA